jgi:hypothetical protein
MHVRAGALILFVACAALAACTPELDWRELSVPEGRYSVLLPGKARSESRTLATASGAVVMTMHAYSMKRGTMVRSEEEVIIDGISGRQIYAEGHAGADEAILKARFIVAGSRLYQIAYVGAKDSVAMADVDMFLSSFKLLR